MEKTWKIYKHTCLENGKSYIGLTSQKVQQRWRGGKSYKQCPLLWNAILAHGGLDAWDIAWTHEIIEDNIKTLEEANNRERYWISYYHTWKYAPECNGYNITPGGDSVAGSRLMSKDDMTIKVSPLDIETYLADGWLFHDSIEYRPIKHRKWYEEHKEEQNARTKKYHEEHKEEQNEINRKNCAEYYKDPEFRARKKAYREAHKEQVAESNRKSHEKRKHDPEYKRKHAESNKRWAEKKKALKNKDQ